jgi:hypothetical protein
MLFDMLQSLLPSLEGEITKATLPGEVAIHRETSLIGELTSGLGHVVLFVKVLDEVISSGENAFPTVLS